MFDFARTIAPAALIFATWVASRFGIHPRRASEPAVVWRSFVSKLSFTIIGTQCRGPTSSLARETPVEGIGDIERLRVRENDCVVGRSFLVDRVDPAEVALHQL